MTRCSVLPFLKANHRHHTTYKDYGRDRYANTINVSPFAHWLIHGVAGLTLVGAIAPIHAVKIQNKIAVSLWPLTPLLKYPNPLQRLIHNWARLPGWGKIAAIALLMLL